jgi:hypothetical protein
MADLASAASAGASAIGGALSFASDSRSMTLPRLGEVTGDVLSAYAMFKDISIDDWRVRLTLPTWPSFRGSAVLKPLKDAGGMIFPYTPTISIQSNAAYTPLQPIHANYKFNAYQHSDPGTITIVAPMNVEDPDQALYWIAALHYFRSITKMFSGNDPKAGNPPPIVQLNAYGSYIFNNVPVVVTGFQTSLDATCDYIPVSTHTSVAGMVNSIASGAGQLAGAVGGAFGLQKVTDTITDITDGISMAATLANSMGLGFSKGGGLAHVPTKSQFTVTLTPMYSRTSARKFSLDNFVSGSYLKNGVGYI